MSFSESPRVANGRLSASTFTRATSVAGSVPITSPTNVLPSLRLTCTLAASSITWLFVTMMPRGSMMTPDPWPSTGTTPNR